MQDQDAIKDSYSKNGFHIFKELVVDKERVQNALAGMDNVRAGKYDLGKPPEESPWNPGDDVKQLCKIEQPQMADRAIADLIRSVEIGELVAAATGAKMVQVWWVQLLYKPPVFNHEPTSTRVGWHHDWMYWKQFWADGSELLTAWFALNDVLAESGAMKFVVGSHLWEGIDGGDFYSQKNRSDDFDVPPGKSWNEQLALLPAGYMSIHHKLTLHGSGRNTSSEPRRSFALHLRTEKSAPRAGAREDLTKYIDDLDICPLILGQKVDKAFA
ncbi:phytanoyl-CoA dioxygenase family protein [bacterium]|nr:phytanoyl-CoA dioxygenase family protein [bacterium]